MLLTSFALVTVVHTCALPIFSIHASAQEATSCLVVTPQSRSGFDPRLRAGGDLATIKAASVAPTFRSTPPRRRRLTRVTAKPLTKAFQSTLPRRGRPFARCCRCNAIGLDPHLLPDATVCPCKPSTTSRTGRSPFRERRRHIVKNSGGAGI